MHLDKYWSNKALKYDWKANIRLEMGTYIDNIQMMYVIRIGKRLIQT